MLYLNGQERAKARRARERAKQKALLKKQQEAAAAEEERGDSPTSPLPPPGLDTSPRHRQRSVPIIKCFLSYREKFKNLHS